MILFHVKCALHPATSEETCKREVTSVPCHEQDLGEDFDFILEGRSFLMTSKESIIIRRKDRVYCSRCRRVSEFSSDITHIEPFAFKLTRTFHSGNQVSRRM